MPDLHFYDIFVMCENEFCIIQNPNIFSTILILNIPATLYNVKKISYVKLTIACLFTIPDKWYKEICRIQLELEQPASFGRFSVGVHQCRYFWNESTLDVCWYVLCYILLAQRRSLELLNQLSALVCVLFAFVELVKCDQL